MDFFKGEVRCLYVNGERRWLRHEVDAALERMKALGADADDLEAVAGYIAQAEEAAKNPFDLDEESTG